MSKYRIAIIGAGNAGCAHAFKLTEAGHQVSLIKTSHAMHDDNFEAITKNGGIWAIDHTAMDNKSFQKIHKITRDIAMGLDQAEIVIVMTQSLQHEDVSSMICQYICGSTKLLLVIPGNLGSVFFRKKIKCETVIIGEGESTPFDARIIEPGVINVLFKNIRNKLGFIPSSRSLEGFEIAKNILDTYTGIRTNVVESALHNPNLIVHTVGVIMSAARIEASNGEFWMYREAFTESIWNLVKQLDKEKNEVIKAFNGVPSSYIDECKYRNEEDLSKDSLAVFKSYADDGGPKGPASIHTRYLYEDVPNGLGLLSDLGKKSGIPTPVSNSLITIASSLAGKDFEKESRTLKKLQLNHLTLNDLINFLE